MPPEQPAPGPLVGRTDELASLAGLVGLADGEAGGAVLLSGDAGVGKTRLLTELRDRARASGWRVMVGHCLDFGDSALPYLPFSEAFGRLALESPALAESLVEARPAVARLMPRHRMLGDDGRATGSAAERTDRADLFESVHAALTQLSQAAPLLLLVEDVHWADQSTREMLSFLFARQFSGAVCVVASYRTDDLHRRHPLRTVAAEWARLPAVSRVQLRPLPDEDVRSLVRVLHPAPMPERDIRDIVDRAEGNAFFTEELVAAAEHGARSLPDDLADLLLVRLDQLGDAARMVVRAAAVAGRRVSHVMLARVVELDGATLDRALRDTVESNVLVPIGADSYAFRHALLAEAVYDDLLPGERVRLHGAYAAVLSAREVEGTAAELARHARAAHDLATAIRASIQAGDEAMAVGGPDEAARHYETALELLGDREVAINGDGNQVDVVDLVIRASDAAEHAGHVHRALALVEDQLRALPVDAPAPQRARLLLALAEGGLYSDTALDVLALTTEAMRLVPAEPATPLRAKVLSMHARTSADRQRDDDAARWATEALALARELGLSDVAADAATTLARLEERAGDPESSRQALQRTVADARAAGEVGAELRGLFNLAMLHYELAQLPEARACFEEAAQRALEVGRPWGPYGLDARGLTGLVAYVAGDWAAATRVLDVAGETPPGLAEAFLAAIGLAVAAGRGKRKALDLMPHLRPWWDREAMVAIHAGSAAIDLYGDAGDLASAIAVHDDVIRTVSELWQQSDFQARIRVSALLLGQLATGATRAGSRERVELAERGDRLAREAGAVAETGLLLGRRRGPEGDAWVARVIAEHTRLRWLAGVDVPAEDDLVAVWEATVDAFDRFGHVFEVARSRARLAAVLRAVGRVDEAAKQADLAREVARRLGAEPLLSELRTLGPAVPGPRPELPRVSRLDEALTTREQEVLALVAQGRSNREIAGQLFISAKTVSVHVSNILAKLGAGGRTEAVAVARRRGLLTDEPA